MRLLILGGTAFVGRHLVEAALARGHEPTLFTRGRTGAELFPGVERVTGDRELDLSQLAGRVFDAAIDTSGYLPRAVRASAGLLAGAVDRYVFVSSISVYADAPVLTETGPTQPPPDPPSEDVGAHYGALKALCEREVEDALPGGALVLRPGLIVGPHDYTGRFGYWPRRVAAGGEVLAPGRPETRVWVIDARDLAAWTIRLVEEGATGIFNATGPGEPLSFGRLLEECRTVAGSEARFTWVDEEFLVARGVAPYTELPLWVPASDGGYPEVDIRRAVAAGLSFRPIGETIRAVLDEESVGPAPDSGLPRPPAGLARAREEALLAEWHAGGAGRTGP